MDRNYIDLHLVVDRYLLGDLSDAETEEFEERLVWDQELIDEVELAERLRAGLKRAVAEDSYTVSTSSTGWLRRMASGRVALPLAASFLLGVGLGSALLTGPGDVPEFSQTEIVPLLAVRGDPDAQEIGVSDAGFTVLLVDVTGAHDSYRATVLRDGAPEPVWRRDGLVTTYPDALALGMPGRMLPPGDYLLRLEGKRDDRFEHIQDLRFRTVLTD